MSAAFIVILAYLIVLPTLSLALARGQKGDPSRAHHDLPAWAICLSIVATETSTLTVVSVPGVAYGNSLVFTGMACGYLIGRLIVALWFLPMFRGKDLASAYEVVGQRFGAGVQCLVSATFLLSRLLAEAVRLFAGMMPIALLCGASGIPGMSSPLGRLILMGVIMLLTMSYTMVGGLRAVIWSDSIQLVLYLIGAVAAIGFLLHRLPVGSLHHALSQAHLFSSGHPAWTDPFTLPAAIIGGTILTLASHGTDQLMIQRCLAARTLRGARGAMIGSAIIVGILFTALSLVGVLIKQQAAGATITKPDQIFPQFILTLPPALSGLLIAGILAATMGSLSSALNAMTGAVLGDFGTWLRRSTRDPKHPSSQRLSSKRLSQGITAFWALALMMATLGFSGGNKSAVLFAFSITAYSYGAVLGVFLLSMLVRQASSKAAFSAFWAAIAVLAVLSAIQIGGRPIAFSWLVPAGALSGLGIGILTTFLMPKSTGLR